MTYFADSLSDLRYERGIVSFRLHAASSTNSGCEIHMPFVDFAEIAALLHRELPKIRPVHDNWLESQSDAERHPQSSAETPAPSLGRRLASI